MLVRFMDLRPFGGRLSRSSPLALWKSGVGSLGHSLVEIERKPGVGYD